MPTRETPLTDFGLLIAYVLPGFLALWGGTAVSPVLRAWFGTPPANAPTVGGFLSLTVASIAAGLTVSTVRWLLVDTLHHRTGIPPPPWDFSALERNVTAFGVLIEIHYRYYQWYANALVALVWVYGARRWAAGFFSAPLGWPDVGFF